MTDELERLRAEVRALEQKRLELNVEIGERDAEIERLRKVLRDIEHDIKECDWTCQTCGCDYGMPETDIAWYVEKALKDQ